MHAPNTPLPAVVLSWQLPPATDPDHAAIEVLDGILSGGESSRLYQSLVYRDRLATRRPEAPRISARASASSPSTASPRAARTRQVLEAALRREVAAVRDTCPWRRQELARLKNQIVTAALKGRETAEGRASSLASDVILENDPQAGGQADRRDPADYARRRAARRSTLAGRRSRGDDHLVTCQAPDAPAPGHSGRFHCGGRGRWSRLPNVPVVVAAVTSRSRSATRAGAGRHAGPVPSRSNGGSPTACGWWWWSATLLPIVTAHLVVPGGSSTDPDGRAGTGRARCGPADQGHRLPLCARDRRGDRRRWADRSMATPIATAPSCR